MMMAKSACVTGQSSFLSAVTMLFSLRVDNTGLPDCSRPPDKKKRTSLRLHRTLPVQVPAESIFSVFIPFDSEQ